MFLRLPRSTVANIMSDTNRCYIYKATEPEPPKGLWDGADGWWPGQEHNVLSYYNITHRNRNFLDLSLSSLVYFCSVCMYNLVTPSHQVAKNIQRSLNKISLSSIFA